MASTYYFHAPTNTGICGSQVALKLANADGFAAVHRPHFVLIRAHPLPSVVKNHRHKSPVALVTRPVDFRLTSYPATSSAGLPAGTPTAPPFSEACDMQPRAKRKRTYEK